MIELENVSFGYNGNLVLENFSLKVNKGEILLVLGKNSSGKTTLAKLMTGLLTPSSGSVRYKIEQKKIAYISQVGGLISNRTIHENLAIGIRYSGDDLGALAGDIEFQCKKFGLWHLIGNLPHALGKSERKKVSLVRSLLQRPDALVIDDLISDLDDVESLRVLQMLKEVKNDKISIVLFSSRLEPDVFIADRIALVENQSLQEVVKAEEFLRDNNSWIKQVNALKNRLKT